MKVVLNRIFEFETDGYKYFDCTFICFKQKDFEDRLWGYFVGGGGGVEK
jgi:hypothetical protein